MKKIFLLLIAFMFLLSGFAIAGSTWVNGYTKKNGTYVQGHYRSTPNQYKYDNYSSKGNVNPYTGKKGYQRNEYSNPPAYNNSYGTGYGSGTNYNNSLYNNGYGSGLQY